MNTKATHSALVAALAVGALFSTQLLAMKPPVTIKFDHAGDNKSRTYFRVVSPGQTIEVDIENTCPEKFSYATVKIPGEPIAADETPTATCQKPGSKKISIVHSEEFGGYIIRIQKDGTDPVTVKLGDGEPVALDDVDLVVSVASTSWDYEISGGFIGSGLTSQKWGLVERVPEGATDGVEKSFLIEDKDAEDSAKLGAAAMINVFHRSWPHIGPTFGLGLTSSSETSYLLGISYRFADVAAVTVGRLWGSVDRLPPGTDITQPVDPNILSSLGTKVDDAWFIGLSFKFLNPGLDVLKKPFKPVEDAKPAADGSEEKKSDSPGAVPASGPAPSLPPLAPANFRLVGAVEADGCGFEMVWDAIKGAKSYQLWIADSADAIPVKFGHPSEEPLFKGALAGASKKYFRVQVAAPLAGDRSQQALEVDASACTPAPE